MLSEVDRDDDDLRRGGRSPRTENRAWTVPCSSHPNAEIARSAIATVPARAADEQQREH